MFDQGNKELIEKFLSEAFQIPKTLPEHLKQNTHLLRFFESIRYSLLNGGKRFRPHLVLSVAKAYQKNKSEFLPFAAAVEMIHTYSLIHDDLPSLDNDDERRGQPTNHKVYGEASALLAGDALLTEAFSLLGKSYQHTPALGLKLVSLLGEAAGVRGMIGGQTLDIMTAQFSGAEEIFTMHEMKTGALIRVAIEGAARIALETEISLPHEKMQSLWKEFGRLLGLSFQIADDVLDHDQQNHDPKNLATVVSLEKTKMHLQNVSDQALEILKKITSLQNLNVDELVQLVEFNRHRKL